MWTYLAITAGSIALTAFYFVLLAYLLISRWPDLGWLLGFGIDYVVSVIVAIVSLVILGLTVFFVVVGGSDFARRFVAGRAIGTLGILIAGRTFEQASDG